MKKNLFLALIIAAFMFGCSAEGSFTSSGNPIEGNPPRGVDWNKKDDTLWPTCSGPGNGDCEE